MSLALATKQSYSEVIQWSPGEVGAALLWLDRKNDAIKAANK